MGFNLADDYAQLQLYGANGGYIDFTNAAEDSDARLIISDVDSINSNVENVKYIVVNDCITTKLVQNLKYKNVKL